MPVSARLSVLPAVLETAIESACFREYLASGYGTCTDIASAMNKEPKVSIAALRQTIRTRLAAGSLFSVDGKVFAGKGTGQLCTVCGMPIFATEVEHEVTEPQRAYAHMTCHSLWMQESKILGKSRE